MSALPVFPALLAAAPAMLDARTPPLRCSAAPQAVNEAGNVAIGGIAQWVSIKGASCANLVILVVHGGPGNPTTI